MRCLFGSSPTVSGTEFALGIPTAEFGTNTAVPDFAQRQRNGTWANSWNSVTI